MAQQKERSACLPTHALDGLPACRPPSTRIISISYKISNTFMNCTMIFSSIFAHYKLLFTSMQLAYCSQLCSYIYTIHSYACLFELRALLAILGYISNGLVSFDPMKSYIIKYQLYSHVVAISCSIVSHGHQLHVNVL